MDRDYNLPRALKGPPKRLNGFGAVGVKRHDPAGERHESRIGMAGWRPASVACVAAATNGPSRRRPDLRRQRVPVGDAEHF